MFLANAIVLLEANCLLRPVFLWQDGVMSERVKSGVQPSESRQRPDLNEGSPSMTFMFRQHSVGQTGGRRPASILGTQVTAQGGSDG